MAADIHRKILVIKLGALGDIVLALGPFAAIREHHPDAEIVLLTTAAYENFLKPCGYFDDIWIDTRPSLWQVPTWLNLKSRLRAGGFTRVYDLQTSDRSGWYFRLFGKSLRPEWSGIARGCSHPHANPDRDFMHSIERQNEQMAMAGISHIPDARLDWVTANTARFGLEERYALFIPGGAAHRLDKRWSADRFSKLAQIIADQGIQPVLLGTSGESELAEEIQTGCSAILNLCGQTDLADIAVLARGAAGAVGNDTGPVHMIAAAGCPTTVLFSAASDPALTAPRGASVEILQRDKLDDLSVEAVAAALRLR
ncbi:MAG: ADP-heptose--LPS heptosyltransferase [Rhodospirillaceae bacterium]|nr:ADP-heptose--LPS heptosyltransferase [Rhodospirillaceae bacterium]|tara:strand:+ start:11678 stop:12613 length:936 start_codon:yes stop_codon:yes gene_type:complete